MGISHYLAMTAEEIAAAEALPERLAYMACHFSPYGTGLTGVPQALPANSMLILNDRIPFCGHDPSVIAQQLAQLVQQLECSCLLLDFQRQDTPETLVQLLAAEIELPVGVTAAFSHAPDHPVFLPPVPTDVPIGEYIKPWTGREIWLDAAPEALQITVDTQGSSKRAVPLTDAAAFPFTDAALCCRYRTEILSDRAIFTLQRTEAELQQLLARAETLGVTTAVSLYQETKKLPVS